MVFSSAVFLFMFLPVVFLGNLLIRPMWGKNAFLIAASLLFYAFGEPVYVFLMILSAFMNYLFGIWLGHSKQGRLRRVILILSVTVNLALLGTFKYAAFVAVNLNHLFGLKMEVPSIALPIGISFFTFQALSYVIDVYRDVGTMQKNFAKVLLYISFFPQLIAGPIVRWGEIERQLDSRRLDSSQIVYGIGRFVKGLFKKLIFANGLGVAADSVFALHIQDYSMLVAWFGAICYTLQIFYDFSGYSDMAIGLAAMFGFRFQENFTHPYSADSIHGFWRRWHISLSAWFREYVYIPLGGNRKGNGRTAANKLIVFLLTGIWHGANWTFVIWGMFHGVMNVLEDVVRNKFYTVPSSQKGRWSCLGNLYTWVIVITAFVMFRAESVAQGWNMIAAMFRNFSLDMASKSFLLEQLSPYNVALLLGGLIFSYPLTVHLTGRIKPIAERYPVLSEYIRYVVIFILLFLCVCSLAGAAYNPFIYFRF